MRNGEAYDPSQHCRQEALRGARRRGQIQGHSVLRARLGGRPTQEEQGGSRRRREGRQEEEKEEGREESGGQEGRRQEGQEEKEGEKEVAARRARTPFASRFAASPGAQAGLGGGRFTSGHLLHFVDLAAGATRA